MPNQSAKLNARAVDMSYIVYAPDGNTMKVHTLDIQ